MITAISLGRPITVQGQSRPAFTRTTRGRQNSASPVWTLLSRFRAVQGVRTHPPSIVPPKSTPLSTWRFSESKILLHRSRVASLFRLESIQFGLPCILRRQFPYISFASGNEQVMGSPEATGQRACPIKRHDCTRRRGRTNGNFRERAI